MSNFRRSLGLTLFSACLCAIGLPTTYASETPSAAAVYAIVHVDIEPAQLSVALPLLQAFTQQASHDPAVQHIEVLQQRGAANHFTLVEVLQSAAAYQQFVQAPYVKTLRSQLQPLLGSPFDERLHGLLAEGV